VLHGRPGAPTLTEDAPGHLREAAPIVPDTQQSAGGQGIVKIQLPAAQTYPPELDGNMRSWGRGGKRPEAVLAARAAGRELEMEAG
jgi:hypothetical protein